MDCSLIIISKSMEANLLFIEKEIYKVGITQSMNGIENHLTRWIQAFAGYAEVEDAHIRNSSTSSLNMTISSEKNITKDLLFILMQTQELVMDKISQAMNVMHEEVEGGILIPRVRNHLVKELISLAVGFADYAEIVNTVALCVDKNTCFTQFLGNNSTSAKWLKDWVKEN